jgi:hypothetical protein
MLLSAVGLVMFGHMGPATPFGLLEIIMVCTAHFMLMRGCVDSSAANV